MLKVPFTMENYFHIRIVCTFVIFLGTGAPFTTAAFSESKNVSYGSHPEQILDLYLPEGNQPDKAFVVIHGGGWSGGKKEDMEHFLPFLFRSFPTYLVANINYRLGTKESPGYPKQLQDITAALQLLNDKAGTNLSYGFLGVSAGGHLSLLYGYKYDSARKVKVIIDIVGPTDFSDPIYAYNIIYNIAAFPLVGPHFYFMEPKIYEEVSPVTWLTQESPPTLGFYGTKDNVVPKSQGQRLKAKLDGANVTNEIVFYEGGHYLDWAPWDVADMYDKMYSFIQKHF